MWSAARLLPHRAPRARRRRPVAAVTLACAVVVGAAACSGAETAYGPGVFVGACRGFAPSGLALDDRQLLDRAVQSWLDSARHPNDPDSLSQGVLAPPSGPVCVVNARFDDGRRTVAMLDSRQLVTYVEPDGSPGSIGTHAALPDPTPLTLPAIPVGDGSWQLATAVTSAEVWVGAPDTAPVVTVLPPTQRIVSVQALVGAFAQAHPTVLPHVLVLARTATALYAATGGAPYAASLDSVLPVALGPSDDQSVAQWRDVLTQPSGVPLLAQVVGFTTLGRQEPQHVTRLLSLVGTSVAKTSGPVLVVTQEPDDGSHLQAEVITLVQLSDVGADAQPVGSVVGASGGWSGSAWLQPVRTVDGDPHELVVMGQPGALGGGLLTLTVSSGSQVATRVGPVSVLTAAEVAGPAAAKTRPPVVVTGVTRSGSVVVPLQASP